MEWITKFKKVAISLLLVFSLFGCSNSVAGNTTMPSPEDVSQADDVPDNASSEVETLDVETQDVFEEDLLDNSGMQADESEIISNNDEEELATKKQLNSFSMMYYLAITAEEIRTSKDNRLALEDIYTSLLNDINPGAIDETTQDHLKNLRDIIKSFIKISTKRDRLQFIYNQEKAAAIKEAVPNPLAILSMVQSLDWRKLAISAVYTIADSYNNYRSASESADMNFLVSGWELDDEELEAIQKNRDRAFDYMVDMVQEYDLNGLLTLNERAVTKFAEICSIEDNRERISRLIAEEATYSLLGNYWLELADAYFEIAQYEKCLTCIDKYNEHSIGIYRQDFNYIKVLPKAIVAAQSVYSDNKYIEIANEYAESIIANTETEDWAIRYFVAQTYVDLFAKTNNMDYLRSAYSIAYNNILVLLNEQRHLNQTYLSDLKEEVVKEPDYSFLSDKEKKEKKEEYKDEQKRVKAYNKELKDNRKTELPTLYEPLVVNCELLFALADKIDIDSAAKQDIEGLLKTSNNGIFLSKSINDIYSFSNTNQRYEIGFDGKDISIPAYLLTAGSEVNIKIVEKDSSVELEDFIITKVDRNNSNNIEDFVAHGSSKQLKQYEWTPDSNVFVEIIYSDAFNKSTTYTFVVDSYQEHWFGDKVIFKQQ